MQRCRRLTLWLLLVALQWQNLADAKGGGSSGSSGRGGVAAARSRQITAGTTSRRVGLATTYTTIFYTRRYFYDFNGFQHVCGSCQTTAYTSSLAENLTVTAIELEFNVSWNNASCPIDYTAAADAFEAAFEAHTSDALALAIPSFTDDDISVVDVTYDSNYTQTALVEFVLFLAPQSMYSVADMQAALPLCAWLGGDSWADGGNGDSSYSSSGTWARDASSVDYLQRMFDDGSSSSVQITNCTSQAVVQLLLSSTQSTEHITWSEFHEEGFPWGVVLIVCIVAFFGICCCINKALKMYEDGRCFKKHQRTFVDQGEKDHRRGSQINQGRSGTSTYSCNSAYDVGGRVPIDYERALQRQPQQSDSGRTYESRVTQNRAAMRQDMRLQVGGVGRPPLQQAMAPVSADEDEEYGQWSPAHVQVVQSLGTVAADNMTQGEMNSLTVHATPVDENAPVVVGEISPASVSASAAAAMPASVPRSNRADALP